MNPIVKAIISGAIGAFVGEMIEPHLVKIIPQTSEFAKKATKAGAAGLATGGAFWLLQKVG